MTKILIDRETVEDAIYALDRVIKNRLALVQLASVANSLRAALEQPEQEPLYTRPPSREWRGLTDEEIHDLSLTMVKGDKSVNWLIVALEAALKEKNT